MSKFSYEEMCEMWAKVSKRYHEEISVYCIVILPILESVSEYDKEIDKCKVFFEEMDFEYGWGE